MNLTLLAAALTALGTEQPLPAEAPPPDTRLQLFVALGALGAAPGVGTSLEGGLRFRAAKHLAVSFDLGYGVLGTTNAMQDRWWLTPSVAATFGDRRVRLDLGAGLGLGASSGYLSWGTYFDAPFDPEWAFQLVPLVRLHAQAAARVSPSVELFVRLEAAALIVEGNTLGLRHGNDRPQFAALTWLSLSFGAQLGVW